MQLISNLEVQPLGTHLDQYTADSSSYGNTLEICLWIDSLAVSKSVPWLRDSAFSLVLAISPKQVRRQGEEGACDSSDCENLAL